MPIITLTLPNDGETIDASDINSPLNAILVAINGGLDDNNIASLSGTKLLANTVPITALNAAAKQGWISGQLPAPTSITANGNRSYSMVFNSSDQSSVLSPGMRLRTTRTVAAPTQCTALNGTTQYFNKTSPTGISFVDGFTCMAWVKVGGYGTNAGVIGRDSGAAGWGMRVNANGQIEIFYGTASAYAVITSFPSIPLNKWVHITAQVTAAASRFGLIYIDGVAVPTTSSGTASSMTQPVADLVIGKNPSTANFFNGKIVQAAVFSSVLSQATIQSYISQGLLGTESSLISAYSLSGASGANDLNTTNANNLTAVAASTTTTADAPFGGQGSGLISSTLDYGIVQTVAYSTNTTVIVQVAEGSTLPTSGGVTALSYATVKTPHGFPVQRNKWQVITNIKSQESVAFGAINTWTPSLNRIIVPIGEWLLTYQGSFQQHSTVTGGRNMTVTLSDTAPANVINQDFATVIYNQGVASQDSLTSVSKTLSYSASTQTTNFIYGWISSATGVESYYVAPTQSVQLIAENAYL